jgi:creatinine amidohydrolase/Fe(II)-dependent formamide hydrolase-like protein
MLRILTDLLAAAGETAAVLTIDSAARTGFRRTVLLNGHGATATLPAKRSGTPP